MDRNLRQSLWRAVDVRGMGSVPLMELHDMLSGRFGKDKDANAGMNVLDKVRQKVSQYEYT